MRIPYSETYRLYISQLFRFARMSLGFHTRRVKKIKATGITNSVKLCLYFISMQLRSGISIQDKTFFLKNVETCILEYRSN